MSDLSGIQKIIYSDDTTNTNMDQRAERKDPSLATDTVDRAVRVMLDNERSEDGYKYEESYIYNLNADDIGPGMGWECLRLVRAVIEDETGYIPTVNVYLVSADGKTEELVHGVEKGSTEWVYDKEKIEAFAKDCCTRDGGRGFISTIDLGLTNPKIDAPPKPVETTVDADKFMNLLEEKGIMEAFYDITEEQGVYAELDSGFVPFEYREQYKDIVDSIREFDPCYGYIAGHDTTRTDNVEIKELTESEEIKSFIEDFVGEDASLYDVDHVKIYIQASDALNNGEIEGSYIPSIETEGTQIGGEQPEKLSIPVSNLVTIECHEKDAPDNVVSRATTIMDGFGRTWNPEGNYSRLNIHNQDFGISSRLTMAAGRSNYLKEADQVLGMCGKEERDRIAGQEETKTDLLNEKIFVMDSVSFFVSVGVNANSPQRVQAQRVQDLKDNRTEIENQYLRTMTAKAYASAKILPVHDKILQKVEVLRSETSKPKKEQDFDKVKKLERMIIQDVREYKGLYERYGVQALALHATNLEKIYDRNDPFLDESRYKETYETQTRWIKEFGPEEDMTINKDLDARVGAFIGSSGVRGQLPAIESRELPDYSGSEVEKTIQSILEEIRDASNEKYSDLDGHKLITGISDRTGTLTIRTEDMVEGYPVLPPFARPDIIDKIKTERYYPITFQSDDQHDFIDNAILLKDDENKDKNLDLLNLSVKKIGDDVGPMEHGENHHLFDMIKGNMLNQTFEKTLLVNVINDIDAKKDGNEKIRIEEIFKDALSKTKEDVANEEKTEKAVTADENQEEDNISDEVKDEKSMYKVQTSPYAKIDPKQEVAISKEKQEELKKEAETEAEKDERVIKDPDKFDEVYKEKYDQKTEAVKEKLTALKEEILHYNKHLATYDDIPFKYRGQHAFYQAAKYEHDKAAAEYEKIGGAVGKEQFLCEGMSVLKMYCSLSDLSHSDYAKAIFLNVLRGKPEQSLSDIYKKEDGTRYEGRSHLIKFAMAESVIRDRYIRPIARIEGAIARAILPYEMKDFVIKDEKDNDKVEKKEKIDVSQEKQEITETSVSDAPEDIEKEQETEKVEEREENLDQHEQNKTEAKQEDESENLEVHFFEDDMDKKEEESESSLKEDVKEYSSDADWLEREGEAVFLDEAEENAEKNEEEFIDKTENEDVEGIYEETGVEEDEEEFLREVLGIEPEENGPKEESESDIETEEKSDIESKEENLDTKEETPEKVEENATDNLEKATGEVDKKKEDISSDNAKKDIDKAEDKREILLSKEEKALKEKLENLPDSISSKQVSNDPDVKGLIGDIRKTAGNQNISDPIAKVVASFSIDSKKTEVDEKTKNICKGMESIKKANGTSVKIKNLIGKTRDIIKEYQQPLGIISPDARILMSLTDRFQNYIESKIPISSVRMEIKAYHDNFTGSVSSFLLNVSKALGDTIEKYKTELKERNVLIVSRIENVMNSISSVTGIDIEKAGAVIKDTIKGLTVGVTKGVLAVISYDPVSSAVEKQETHTPKDVDKEKSIVEDEKSVEWTPKLSIIESENVPELDTEDTTISENSDVVIDDMGKDELMKDIVSPEEQSPFISETDIVSNEKKEDIEQTSEGKADKSSDQKETEMEQSQEDKIEEPNLSKEDSITKDKPEDIDNTSVDREKDIEPSEKDVENGAERDIESPSVQQETTVDTTNENPVDETLEKNDPSDDSSEKQEEKNTDVDEKKAEDFTDAAMAIESETKDMEKDKDAEETDVPEQNKTGKEETGGIDISKPEVEITSEQTEDISFVEDVTGDSDTKEDLKDAVTQYLEETDSSPLLEQTYDQLSEYDTMTAEEKTEFLEKVVSGIEEYIEKNNDKEEPESNDIVAEKVGDLLADMASSMQGSLDDNIEIAKTIVESSGIDSELQGAAIDRAYETLPELIEKEPEEMEIGGVVSDGENAWTSENATITPSNAQTDVISQNVSDFESTNPVSDALEALQPDQSMDTGVEQENALDNGLDTGLDNTLSTEQSADESTSDIVVPDATSSENALFINDDNMSMQTDGGMENFPAYDDSLSFPDSDPFSVDTSMTDDIGLDSQNAFDLFGFDGGID